MARQLGNDSCCKWNCPVMGDEEQKHCLPGFLPLSWFSSGAFADENNHEGRKTMVKPTIKSIKKSKQPTMPHTQMVAFRKVATFC